MDETKWSTCNSEETGLLVVRNRKKRLPSKPKKYSTVSEPLFSATDINYKNNINGGGNGSMYPLHCKKCGKIIETKQVNYYHKKHCKPGKKTVSEKKECEFCFKTCHKRSLWKHLKTCRYKGVNEQNLGQLKTETKEFICDNCGLAFLSRKGTIRHLNSCPNPRLGESRIICLEPQCALRFSKYSQMLTHMDRSHDREVQKTFHSFVSWKDFLNWRDDIQLDTYMYPITYSGPKKKKDLNSEVTYIYMICQYDKPRFHENEISVWSKGYTPHIPCPARMVIHRMNSGKVEVCLINEHTHPLKYPNTRYHRLPVCTRNQIINLVALDVPTKNIENLYQEEAASAEIYEGEGVVTDFVSWHNIRNYRYRYANFKFHPNDLIALKIWIKNNRAKVFLFKDSTSKTPEIGSLEGEYHDDLFVLGIQRDRMRARMREGVHRIICVDETHKTNPYKFQLVNFVVPDSYGRMYPVAHFIVNHTDERTFTSIFHALKARPEKLDLDQGQNLDLAQAQPLDFYAVMTDDSAALFNALKNVFSNPNYRHILCHWHIRNNWEKNLSKIKDSNLSHDDITAIKKEVMIILEELLRQKNRTHFLDVENKFMEKFSELPATKAFMEYYKIYYHKRPEKWASAFRNFPHFNVNENMLVESFHNTLKNKYLRGKPPRRVMSLIEALVHYENAQHMRLKKEELLGICLQEGGLKITAAHADGMKISNDDVETIIEGQQWRVRSQEPKTRNVFYSVSRKKDYCDLLDHCYEHCWWKKCENLCLHLYTCECPVIHSMCKHIHKVHSMFNKNVPSNLVRRNSKLLHAKTLESKKVESKKVESKVLPSEKIPTAIKDVLEELTHLNQQPLALEDHPLLHQIWKNLCHTKYIFNAMNSASPNDGSLLRKDTMQKETIPPNAHPEKQIKKKLSSNSKKSRKNRPFNSDFATRQTVIRNLYTSSKTFSGPMGVDVSFYRDILFRIGSIDIQNLYLKSLDPYISDEEAHFIGNNVSPDFNKGWLYDNIIDAFFHLKCEQTHRTVCYISTAQSQHFICNDIPKNLVLLEENILFEYIFIPCNPNKNHWTLLVVTPRAILALDPLNDRNSGLQRYAEKWQIEILRKTERFLPIEYPMRTRQPDNMSCGVLVCWYLDQLINTKPLVDNVDTDKFRKNIFDEIMRTCDISGDE